MKTIKASRIVTILLSLVALIFVGLIVHSVLQKNRPLSAASTMSAVPGGQGPGGMPASAGQGPGGQPPAGQQGGGQAGGAQRSGAGGQGSGGAPAAAPGGQTPGGAPPAASGGQTPPSGGQRAGAQTSRNATAVRVTPMVLGTIENSIVINGDVLTRTQVAIYPTVAGKITEIRLRPGDTVRAGDTVAMIDPSRPGEVYSRSAVVSTIGGTILSTPVSAGDTVSLQTAVITVGDLSSLVIETFVPERFANAARLGLSAQVSLEALPGETFPAVVEEVNPILDPASRTLRIRLRFTQRDDRIRAGMFAQVSLVTNSRQGIPVIPRGAVINTYGSWIVFTVDQNNIAHRREITLGMESETLLEVTGGLELGDRVVTAGQNFLSNNDPVRVVD